ncbi:sugar phosphate nucleotidyltransferase, partial [Nocardioides abyssi]|uniref:sugar phosphate nucleotidyltransferase n=1 Tax=Nocardioides abyssi TaxID=3058370 RepID=UPI002620784F
GDRVLVISGDVLTDFDLSEIVAAHEAREAEATIALTHVENPLAFGIVIADPESGRIERFLEKPTWGEVFSDTINTGIYVLEPEALSRVPPET